MPIAVSIGSKTVNRPEQETGVQLVPRRVETKLDILIRIIFPIFHLDARLPIVNRDAPSPWRGLQCMQCPRIKKTLIHLVQVLCASRPLY
jgi:hypothetical protein